MSNPTAKLFPTEQVRARLHAVRIFGEHLDACPLLFLVMKRVMKRRFEEEDAMNRSKEPNEDDADLQQGPDLTQAIIKPGFECFDLSPRMERLADDLRQSMKHNQAIKEGKLRLGLSGCRPFRPSILTGLVTFKNLEVPACKQLAAFMCDPANRSPEGYLVINGKPFPGYNTYDRVHGEFNPALQAMQTTKIHGRADVQYAASALKPLLVLLLAAAQKLYIPDARSILQVQTTDECMKLINNVQRRCRAIHLLRQDKHANAVFSWHDDLNDLKGLRPKVSEQMASFIVQLNDGDTAMRLYDFEPHKFSHAGDCAVFNGAAVHESLPWKDCTSDRVILKAAFFFD